jgi:hypothetical protein
MLKLRHHWEYSSVLVWQNYHALHLEVIGLTIVWYFFCLVFMSAGIWLAAEASTVARRRMLDYTYARANSLSKDLSPAAPGRYLLPRRAVYASMAMLALSLACLMQAVGQYNVKQVVVVIAGFATSYAASVMLIERLANEELTIRTLLGGFALGMLGTFICFTAFV